MKFRVLRLYYGQYYENPKLLKQVYKIFVTPSIRRPAKNASKTFPFGLIKV